VFDVVRCVSRYHKADACIFAVGVATYLEETPLW